MLRNWIIVLFAIFVPLAAYADINNDLINAARRGQAARVQVLLDAGADVNARDSVSFTALIFAAEKGHTNIVHILLDAGADVNAQADFGETALMGAAGSDHTKTVQILLDSGADVNVQDVLGQTAFIIASKNSGFEAVRVLLDAGAIKAVLNDSDVRVRTKPTTKGSRIIDSLDKGDVVYILGKSKNEEKISNMTAPWYKIKIKDGTMGYSYGYFFDVDEAVAKRIPTF